jgi:hypothetical protein
MLLKEALQTSIKLSRVVHVNAGLLFVLGVIYTAVSVGLRGANIIATLRSLQSYFVLFLGISFDSINWRLEWIITILANVFEEVQ